MRGYIVTIGFKKAFAKTCCKTRSQARRRKILKAAANRHFRRSGNIALCTERDAS